MHMSKTMTTSQFHSAASRRLLQRVPPGAGGFAGQSVEPSNVANTMGGSGINVETSPVVVHDDEGRMIPFPKGDGTYRPAHFEVIHSSRRNPDIYEFPDSFRLKFSKPLRGVFAIQLLEVNLPNVDATAPDDREFLILNGLIDTNGKFRPQENLPKDRSFHTMMMHDANDPGVVRSAASNAAIDIFQYDDYAFGRFAYDPTKALQHWNRSGWHRTTWFPTPVNTLDYIDFSVADANGNAYDFAPGDNWSATMMIFSKQ
jgi:hypothetical protein